MENFLLKLDMAQRELGKDPQNFVPLKYAMGDDEPYPISNIIIGGVFILGLIRLYRTMHGKGGSSSGSSGSKGGGGFGGGGMSNMF